jgi:hypothetical protein
MDWNTDHACHSFNLSSVLRSITSIGFDDFFAAAMIVATEIPNSVSSRPGFPEQMLK